MLRFGSVRAWDVVSCARRKYPGFAPAKGQRDGCAPPAAGPEHDIGLHLRTFGALDLRTSEGASAGLLLAQPRSTALLAYLLLARPEGYLSRDTLCAIFFPDADHEHARGALSQTLTRIRRQAGHDVLELRGKNEIRVKPGAVACDVLAFDEALSVADHATALELYAGPFLMGFHVHHAPGFERWAEEERDRLRVAAAEAARAVAMEHLARSRLSEAGQAAARALALAPESEAMAAELVRALAEAGNRAGAVALYDAWAGTLARDLDLEPTDELQDVARELRDAAIPGPGEYPDAGPSPPAAGAGAPGPSMDAPAPTRSADRDGAAPDPGEPVDPAGGAGSEAPVRWGLPRQLRRTGAAGAAAAVVLLAGTLGLARAGFLAAEFPVEATGSVAEGLSRGDWLVVADFDVPGGDSALALAFQILLIRDVESAGYASVVGGGGALSRRALEDVLERMRLPPGAPITPGLACDVAEREGAAGVLAGRVLPLGNDYVLTASILRGPRCEEVIRTSAVASFDELSPAVMGVSRELRSRLGESRSSIRSSPPLPPIAATHVEAVRAVSRYISTPELWDDEERGGAQLLEALRIDPDCAFAHFALALHYQRLGRFDRTMPHVLRAYELRSQLPRGGRLGMEALYQRYIASDPAAAIATVTTVMADYPTMADATMPFVADAALWLGDWRRALDVSLEHLRTGPTGLSAHLSFGRAVTAAWAMGRVELADSLERARVQALAVAGATDDPAATLLHRLRHRDWEGAESLCAERPGWDRCGHVYLARGRLGAAAAVFRETLAADSAGRGPWNRAAAVAGLAHVEWMGGRTDNALGLLEQGAVPALAAGVPRAAMHLNRFLLCASAAEFGHSHDLPGCAVEKEDPAEWDADPSFTIVLRSGAWSRRLLAARALEAGDAGAALERAREAVHSNFDNPATVDHLLQALAFDALARPDSARAHYLAATRIERDPGFPTAAAILFPLAPVHRRLGELAEEAGDVAAAVNHYGAFLYLWAEADPELRPQVEAVRARLKRLPGGG